MEIDIKQLLRRLDLGVLGIDNSLEFENKSNDNIWKLNIVFQERNLNLYIYFLPKEKLVHLDVFFKIYEDEEDLWLEDINKANIELAGSGISVYVEDGFISLKTPFYSFSSGLDEVATYLNIGIQTIPLALKML